MTADYQSLLSTLVKNNSRYISFQPSYTHKLDSEGKVSSTKPTTATSCGAGGVVTEAMTRTYIFS